MDAMLAATPGLTETALEDDGLRRLLRCCSRRDGHTVASYKGHRLSSAFQPIFSLAHGQGVGGEALVRAEDGEGAAVSPDRLFGSVRRARDLRLLDGLCRVLHLANFSASGLDGWLFLNVDPATLRGADHGATSFDGAIDHFGLPRERVVVEILEKRIPDEQVLAASVEWYRSFGCLIALDDFGVGQSNFDRIWRLAPEIVKLDRQLLAHAGASERVRRSLPNLVGLLHEAGCVVLAEGIEQEDEALLALDAGVDLAQGYFFARPRPLAAGASLEPVLSPATHGGFLGAQARCTREWETALLPYRRLFEQVVARVAEGGDARGLLQPLLGLEHVLGFCVLDLDGRPHPAHPLGAEVCALPSALAPGAPGHQRPCFRKALEQPGKIQFTGPHRARRSTAVCSTLSCAVRAAADTFVLCLDLREPGLRGRR